MSGPAHLVVVAGHAGSGKTWVGQRLAAAVGAAFLDKDTMTRPLVEGILLRATGNPHDRESELYLNEVRPLEYRCLQNAAFENLECGLSTVVAAPFVREVRDPDWRAEMELEASSRGGRFSLVWVRSDPDALYQRLVDRGTLRDEHKLTHWDEFVCLAGIEKVPPCACDVIDNRDPPTRPLARQIADLAVRLSE